MFLYFIFYIFYFIIRPGNFLYLACSFCHCFTRSDILISLGLERFVYLRKLFLHCNVAMQLYL